MQLLESRPRAVSPRLEKPLVQLGLEHAKLPKQPESAVPASEIDHLALALKLSIELRTDRPPTLLPRSRSLPPLLEEVENLSCQERHAIAKAFFEITNIPIRRAIINTLRGDAMKRACAVFGDRPEVALAIAVKEALEIWSPRLRCIKVIALLKSADPMALKKLSSQMPIDQLLSAKIEPLQAKQAMALLEQDRPKALAYQARMYIVGDMGPAKDLRQTFREAARLGIVPEFIKAYQNTFNSSLMLGVQRCLLRGPAIDLCLAIMSRDSQRIDAAEIRCALKIREDWIASPFIDKPQSRRLELIAAYDKCYGEGRGDAFFKDLRQAVWQEDHKFFHRLPFICSALDWIGIPHASSYSFIRQIIRRGKLSDAEKLRYFIDGMGTDAPGIRAVLKDRTKADLAQIRTEYTKRYPRGIFGKYFADVPIIGRFFRSGDLDRDVLAELCGKDHFDVSRYLRGTPQTAEEAIKLLQEKLEYERGSGLIRKLLESNLTPRRFSRALVAAREDVAKATSYLADKKGQEDVRVLKVAEYALEQMRELKTKLAKLLANAATLGGAIGGALIAYFHHNPPMILVLGGALCGKIFARFFIRRSIERGHYSWEDGFWDLMRDSLDAAAFFFLATGKLGAAIFSAAGKIVGASVSKRIVRQGMKLGLGRAVGSVESFFRHQNRLKKVLAQAKATTSMF